MNEDDLFFLIVLLSAVLMTFLIALLLVWD